MPERLRHFLDYLPFVALVVNNPRQTPFVTKMMETAVMSCVAAGFATYIGVELLKVEITNIKAAIQTVDAKVERIRNDMYVPRGSQ